jgi:hypothetical protein
LFTSAQLRALWLRDGTCTFPDCTVPATWCDGHHLWHWADGGPTDLANAALLCGRHHTIAHRKGYHAEIRDGRVEWDLTPGGYDHWLSQHRAAAAFGRPPETRAYDVWGELDTGAARRATTSGFGPAPPWPP